LHSALATNDRFSKLRTLAFNRTTTELRTKRPDASAAFADVEKVRILGGEYSAMQRISPNQPFSRIDPAGFQTAI